MSIDLRFKLTRSSFALDLDIQLPGQGINALFGHSGAGKTTLLRAIAGFENDPEGLCRVNGQCWQDGAYRLPTHKRELGYVFQEAGLFEHLNVRDNLLFAWKRLNKQQRRIAPEQVEEWLGIAPLFSRPVSGLSGGERQRIAIGRALLSSPRLLLMDEPLAALDRRSRLEILPYLERLHTELAIPVIYVSHSLEEVARLADHLVVVKQGRVQSQGKAIEMLSQLDLAATEGRDAEALIEAQIEAHDERFRLSYLRFSGGRFSVPQSPHPVGCKVRVQVLARDVSITLGAHSDTSILNVFPAYIDEMQEDGPSQCLMRLKLHNSYLLARISKKSAHKLDLKAGKPVYAQVKTAALVDA